MDQATRNRRLIAALLAVIAIAVGIFAALRPGPEDRLVAACQDIAVRHLPTGVTLDVTERTGRSRGGGGGWGEIFYTRQNLAGATVRGFAQCDFAAGDKGGLRLLSARIEVDKLTNAQVQRWNTLRGPEFR